MFMVRWEGRPPTDRDDWIETMRPVFQGAGGAYYVRFYQGEAGWRFDLECHDEPRPQGELIANGPEGTRYNLYRALVARQKPVDPRWEP